MPQGLQTEWIPSDAPILPFILAMAGAIALAYISYWYVCMRRALARKIPPRTPLLDYPVVTVVRPVRGADVGAEQNFRAALETDYPGHVETFFVFDDAKDAGVPIAERVVAEHRANHGRGCAYVFIAGAPPQGWTGKLHAMKFGAERASGRLIAFGDSDTRPSPTILTNLVETLLTTRGAGCAFAPVLVADPPQAAGDVFYALMQNALYSPLAAKAAGSTRDLPFIMGQLMVFGRDTLKDIGGVDAAKGQLVDDMYLGRCVAQAGYRNILADEPLNITTGGMSLRAFLPVYRRWITFSRNGLPMSFTWRQWCFAASYFVSLIAAAIALAVDHGSVAILPLAAVAASGAAMLAIQKDYGGAAIPWRFAWVPWLLFLFAPIVLASISANKKVNWRGRIYRLDDDAALAEKPRDGAASSTTQP